MLYLPSVVTVRHTVVLCWLCCCGVCSRVGCPILRNCVHRTAATVCSLCMSILYSLCLYRALTQQHSLGSSYHTIRVSLTQCCQAAYLLAEEIILIYTFKRKKIINKSSVLKKHF